MTIIYNSKRFDQHIFPSEKELEDEIITASKYIFGTSSVYIDAKKKLDAKSLGTAVPDGFLFDFSDPTDCQFYIIEIELAKHDFYGHIFRQITKFFAFYKNNKLKKSLIDKLFSIINTDHSLQSNFKKYLGHVEIYKFLSDILESSQNILLVIDQKIPELPEIIDTYTDTWGKMVRVIEIQKFINEQDVIYHIEPDFETIQYLETSENNNNEVEEKYSEEFHLTNVNQSVKDIYYQLKTVVQKIDDKLVFNPQKYYISVKSSKNIAFIKIRNTKIRLIPLIPEEKIKELIHNYPITSLSINVQKFYNGPCAAIIINNTESFEDIESLFREVVAYNLKPKK